MNYHNTLRRVKYLALAWVLFALAGFLVNHYLIALPSWIVSGGMTLIGLGILYPFGLSKPKEQQGEP